MKYSDITSGLQRRARKVTNARGLYILNELVHEDIYEPVAKTFPDFFEQDHEVVVVDGTLEYDLPDGYYATITIKDQGENIIVRGANTARDVAEKNKVQIYSGKLHVNADNTHSKLYLRYYKELPAFDETTDIALPDDITAALKNVWVTGLEYFYFSESKKSQETQTSFARYNDSKARKLTYGIRSLSR